MERPQLSFRPGSIGPSCHSLLRHRVTQTVDMLHASVCVRLALRCRMCSTSSAEETAWRGHSNFALQFKRCKTSWTPPEESKGVQALTNQFTTQVWLEFKRPWTTWSHPSAIAHLHVHSPARCVNGSAWLDTTVPRISRYV